MPRLEVCMYGAGGLLDCRTASSPEDAVRVLAEMAREAGELHDGDRFVIETHPDD
jgi:hypothetical protein